MSWSGLPFQIEKYVVPEPNSGCWLWVGGLRDKKEGYGGCGWQGKIWRSHRLAYTLLRGPVAPDLTLDHLCRNRICCNPDHLEPVARGINIARGIGVAPKNALKTHCPQGHEYTETNTYVWKSQRFCRTCHNVYTRKNRKK